MKMEYMDAAMTGITTRPKAATKGAITGIVPKDDKKTMRTKRTTIIVYPDTYRKFKVYAAQTGQSISALINEFMKKTTSEGK